jgi:RND family efflux transporter MFP subunit
MSNRWTLLTLGAALLLTTAIVPALNHRLQAASNRRRAAVVQQPGKVTVPNCSVKLMHEVILSAERPGILGSLDVVEGDQVAEGRLLAKIKDEVPLATLAIAAKEAESDVDIRFSEKAYDVARVEWEKAEEANRRQKNTVPEVEVRRAKLAADKAQLEIEKARHMHEVNGLKQQEAEVQVKTCRIEAPFDGFVTKVYLSRGAPVRQGDPVVELLDISRVKIEGFVPLAQAIQLKPGLPVQMAVSVKLEGVERNQLGEVSGTLMFVDRRVNTADNKVRIWAEVRNPPDWLRAGLQAEMEIVVAEPEKGAE